jgi:demethylspheroidene O-methyltransferase
MTTPSKRTWVDAFQQSIITKRNQLLVNPNFQRWAAGFFLTRPIVRQSASAVFDLVSGFIYSQILLACVRLNLFEILHEAPHAHALNDLAERLDLTPSATKRLLDAAVSLNLVTRIGKRSNNLEDEARVRYALGMSGAPLVGNKAVLAMVEHHAMVYADFRDPLALLRGAEGEQDTALANYWPYAANKVDAEVASARISAYTKLMSASQPLVADEILDAYPFDNHHQLLDVGGGDGSFLARVAARHAHLQLQLFDLPAVALLAQEKFIRLDLQDRATATGGNFLSEPMPVGADIISFVRIIHDHDDIRVRQLLNAARIALLQTGKTGRVLIAEPMADTAGATRMGDAYFGFYLLAMGRGRARTPSEISELLKSCGFSAPTLLSTRLPMQTSVLVAGISH